MKKSDSQKDFLKKLREVDDLEPSLEPKDARLSVADLNLNPQKLASEIEQYLNEEPASANADLSAEISGRQLDNPLGDKLIIKHSGPQKIVDENLEKMAVDDLSAQEYFAQHQADDQADSQPATPKNQPPTEQLVSLIGSQADDFSVDSDFDADSPRNF